MDTIKIPRKQALMVAHRGVSSLERENSVAAFVAAGNRSYFGIETDVHKTADGSFVIIHDKTTGRVSPTDVNVEECSPEELAAVRLYGYDGQTPRADLCLPSLSDYIAACRRYGKTAVLELKSNFSVDDLRRMCEEIETQDYLSHVIFISFSFENLRRLREVHPEQPVQYLRSDANKEELIALVKKHGMDLDVHFDMITKEFVDACHKEGIKVNVWTVDSPELAENVIDAGVDFVTSNRLE
ncbi:MAG: hypothetical protein IKM52_02965 [Clostridia bacterium]|nr:hypothetical protein [Clostridia bacterium]